MTRYSTLVLEFSNSHLNKLKSGIKNGTKVTLNLRSNVIGDSNDKTKFLYKLILFDTQVPRLHKVLQMCHQLI